MDARTWAPSSCSWRSRPAAPSSSTQSPATRPRPRSVPGAMRTVDSGGRSTSAAGPSRWSRLPALRGRRSEPRGSCAAGPRSSGPAEPDAEIREELARIERAILQGAVQILDEFGGLQAAMKRSVALEKRVRRQAVDRSAAPPLGGPCASKGRATDDRRTSHGRTRVRKRREGTMRILSVRRCARARRRKPLRGNVLHLRGQAGRRRTDGSCGGGSDPPVRGPGTARGRVCVCTHPAPPLGVAPDHQSLAGRSPSAAASNRTGRGVRGAVSPPPANSGGARVSGDRRGAEPPLARLPCKYMGVAWLMHLSLRRARQTRPPMPGTWGRQNLHTVH